MKKEEAEEGEEVEEAVGLSRVRYISLNVSYTQYLKDKKWKIAMQH